MATIDFRTPAAGFDQPLELWLACHERVQRMTKLLTRLAPHLAQHGAEATARETATSIRRYFDQSAPHHHDDEEVDLFPLLRQRVAARGDDALLARLDAAVRTLEREHVELGEQWRELRAVLLQVEAGAAAIRLDDEAVRRFVDGYRAHIELEEGVIAPALRAALTEDDLQAIGRAMAARRGADWNTLVGSPN